MCQINNFWFFLFTAAHKRYIFSHSADADHDKQDAGGERDGAVVRLPERRQGAGRQEPLRHQDLHHLQRSQAIRELL